MASSAADGDGDSPPRKKLNAGQPAVTVDGSLLEGGGQVVRNAMAFAALQGTKIVLEKIRGGRQKPGLRAQHVTGMRLVAAIVGGTLEGDAVQSARVVFEPSDGKQGAEKKEEEEAWHEANTQTAGSIALLLQTSLPPALFRPRAVRVRCTGGTNAELAPSFEYVARVFAPVIRRCTGAQFDVQLRRRGYFPRGGGVVELVTEPVRGALRPIQLTERGDVTCVSGEAVVGGSLPLRVAERMRDAAVERLRAELGEGVRVEVEAKKEAREFAPDAGCFIFLRAETTTGVVLGTPNMCGKRKKPAEKVGREAASHLLREIAGGGCLDSHLQDQVIVFMALADGHSHVVIAGEPTLHTKTAIHWAQELTGAKFHVSKNDEGNGLTSIECDGVGLIGGAGET